jgi:hypothetical protein
VKTEKLIRKNRSQLLLKNLSTDRAHKTTHLRNRFKITVETLHNGLKFAARSLGNHKSPSKGFTIDLKALRKRYENTAQPLCNPFAITVQSLRYHFAITVQSLRNHCAIALESLRKHFTIAA